MSMSEFIETFRQQGDTLGIIVPVLAALVILYIFTAGGFLAIQRVRKKQDTGGVREKQAMVVVSLVSALLVAIAAGIVINIVRRVSKVLYAFRENAPAWAEQVGTDSFRLQLLTLNSKYTFLFWGSAALAAILIAACFLLARRAKRTCEELQTAGSTIRHTKGIIEVTSSIIPEYDTEDEEVGCGVDETCMK